VFPSNTVGRTLGSQRHYKFRFSSVQEFGVNRAIGAVENECLGVGRKSANLRIVAPLLRCWLFDYG